MKLRLERQKLPAEAEDSLALRKVYVAPHLLEYGSVAKLTQGGGSKNNDNGPMTQPFSAPSGPAPAKMR